MIHFVVHVPGKVYLIITAFGLVVVATCLLVLVIDKFGLLPKKPQKQNPPTPGSRGEVA